jgi:hypothetical protein
MKNVGSTSSRHGKKNKAWFFGFQSQPTRKRKWATITDDNHRSVLGSQSESTWDLFIRGYNSAVQHQSKVTKKEKEKILEADVQ